MIDQPDQKKKVLVAPLDWGLGHATRCVPIILAFQAKGCEVAVASSGSALTLLRLEFPRLKFHALAAYRARYSLTIPFMLHIFWQLPKFFWAMAKEHRQLQRIIKKESIDLVVSDSRYGAWSSHVPTVFITHQVNILMPPYLRWLMPVVNFFNHRQLRKFSYRWVPDRPGSTFTGNLTKSNSVDLKFVGLLSRLKKGQGKALRHFDVIAILSGPEPQRTAFEEKLVQQLTHSGREFLIVRGLPGSTQEENGQMVNHATGEELSNLIADSDLVICRSGYSSIMDLVALEAKVVLVPTPGQTEQEYLAEELEKRGMAFYQSQSEFSLERALSESGRYTGFAGCPTDSNLLTQTIDELLLTLK